MSSYSTFPNEDEADGGIGKSTNSIQIDQSESLPSSHFSPEAEAESVAEEEVPSSSPAPTKSQIIFVKFVFYMLGCGFLLPWNSFIAAESYFLSRFIQSCPSSENYGTGLLIAVNKELSIDSNGDKEDGSDFMSWLGLLYNLSGVIALMFLLLKSHYTRDMNKSVHHHRRHHHQTQQEELESFLSATENQEDTNYITISNKEDKIQQQSQQWNVIVTTLVIYLIIMIITSIFVLIPSFNNSPTSIKWFKILTFICIIICGTNGAFISSNIVSYANMYFPPLYSIQCYVSGQALGGMSIAILNLSLDYFVDGKNEDIFWKEHCSNETIVFSDGSDRQLHATIHEEDYSSVSLQIGSLLPCHDYSYDWGAFSYFVTSCFFLILCIALFIMLDSSSIFEYYRNQRMMACTMAEDCTNDINHLSRNNDGTTSNRASSSMYDHQSSSDTSNNIEFIDHPSLQEPLLNDSKDYQNENRMIEQTRDDSSGDRKNVTAHVFNKIQSPIISIFITFFITLTIFPSWTGSLTSTQQCQTGSSRLRNDLFTPFMVVLFNVFDLIGRTSSGFIMSRITRSNIHAMNSNSEFDMFSMTSKKVMLLSTFRFIFLPAFYLCKNNPFKSDIYTVMVMVLFASSNGVASNLNFIHAATLLNANPQDSNDEAMQSVASTLLNFAVGLGLLSGSMFSFIYNYFGLQSA